MLTETWPLVVVCPAVSLSRLTVSSLGLLKTNGVLNILQTTSMTHLDAI